MAKKNKSTNKLYTFFCALRILLVFLPQTAYIHPDEFFQTTEVLASRIFQLETSLPWEFNVTTPIRSIGVPYFTIGMSYQMLNTANLFIGNYLGIPLVTSYTLLVTPRILLCALSFLLDYCLLKICAKNNEKSRSRLMILSSSYVTLVFCSRTFTNSLEVILFTLLLYFVADSMIFSNIIVRQREYLNKRYENSRTPTERVKFYKLKSLIASHSYRNCLEVSTICVLGLFNRPTFACFALLPVFFWLYRGIGYKSVKPLEFNLRIFVLILLAIPSVIFLVIVDSFFYGYITWGEIGVLDVSINSFTFPPWNFLKYNIDANNLAKHGLHPRYLNLLVNVPLLFNLLGLIGIFSIADLFIKLFQKKFNLLPTVRSIKGLMLMSVIAPTFLLSLFPHQEPRFLIPIILPLVYLYSDKIHKEQELDLVHIPKASVSLKNDSESFATTKQSHKNTLFKLWLVINVIFTILFGFLHQGGVYLAANHLSREFSARPHLNYHIVTSHIYSIPHMFFVLPDSQRVFSRGNTKYQRDKFVFTHEEGSRDLQKVLGKMFGLLEIAESGRKRYKMYFLLSGSKHDELIYESNCFNVNESSHFQENDTFKQEQAFNNNNNVTKNIKNRNSAILSIKYIQSFYPHLSVEALPDFSEIVRIFSATSTKNLSFSEIMAAFGKFLASFDLRLYEVQIVK